MGETEPESVKEKKLKNSFEETVKKIKKDYKDMLDGKEELPPSGVLVRTFFWK